MAGVRPEHGRHHHEGDKEKVDQQVILPMGTPSPHSPETQNHHRAVGKGVNQVGECSTTGAWQNRETGGNLAEPIDEGLPRVCFNIGPGPLGKPLAFEQLTSRPRSLFTFLLRRKRIEGFSFAQVAALLWVVAKQEAVIPIPELNP